MSRHGIETAATSHLAHPVPSLNQFGCVVAHLHEAYGGDAAAPRCRECIVTERAAVLCGLITLHGVQYWSCGAALPRLSSDSGRCREARGAAGVGGPYCSVQVKVKRAQSSRSGLKKATPPEVREDVKPSASDAEHASGRLTRVAVSLLMGMRICCTTSR